MPQIALSDVWTSAGAGLWATAIIGLVAVLQNVTQIPFPEGSVARNLAVAALAGLVVLGAGLISGQQPNPNNVSSAVITWATVVAGAAGLHLAGATFAVSVRAKNAAGRSRKS